MVPYTPPQVEAAKTPEEPFSTNFLFINTRLKGLPVAMIDFRAPLGL
jgi:hypothetical protein